MTEFVEGNRITLLTGGGEYFPALETECDAARHEIHIETYIFEDDVAGLRIAAALKRAAQRGVATHLLVDGYGSRKLSPALAAGMQSAGVRLHVYRPDIAPWTFQRQRLRRMHRKLAVIDARVAFVGCINIIDEMHTPGQTPPRFDYAVRIEGPLLRSIHPVVKKLWALVEFTQFGQDWHQRTLLQADHAPRGRQRAAFVVRDNLRHRRDIEEAYLAAIAGARSEILIASSYFFPGVGFRRALVEAAARGVRVVLLLQGRVEYVLPHYAAQGLYDELLREGVEIVQYRRSFLHAKVAVIDDRATVGSSNIDPFSLLLAREANIFVNDRAFAQELRQRIERLIAEGGEALQLVHHRRRPLLVRLFNRFALLVMRVGVAITGMGQGY